MYVITQLQLHLRSDFFLLQIHLSGSDKINTEINAGVHLLA